MVEAQLSEAEEDIARKLVDSAVALHKALGPGLLESVYEVCLCHELGKRGVRTARQVVVPLEYDGLRFDEAFRLDILAGDRVICEVKAVKDVHPVAISQLLTQLRLTNRRLGFLINFNVRLIKHGIRRFVI